jgi:hypothetical protein
VRDLDERIPTQARDACVTDSAILSWISSGLRPASSS